MGQPRPQFTEIAARIEQELRRLHAWEEPRPAEEELAVTSAFGGDTMPFTRWIQFILLDRLHAVARGDQDPPTHSEVGTYAARELDGWGEASELASLLSELDVMIMRSAGSLPEGLTEDEELDLMLQLDEERRREGRP